MCQKVAIENAGKIELHLKNDRPVYFSHEFFDSAVSSSNLITIFKKQLKKKR